MPAEAAGGPPPEFEPETDGAVPWLFLCPSLLSVAVLVLLPFLDAVRRSFFSAMSGQFVGFKNYAAVLRNEAFRLAAANTARFVLVCIPLLLGFSLLLALLVKGVFARPHFSSQCPFLWPPWSFSGGWSFTNMDSSTRCWDGWGALR